MLHQDIVSITNSMNRAMLLTAPGTAAIAVVRLIGPAVELFLSKRFSKPVALHRCVHGLLNDGDRTIDDALVVRCAAGIADLNLHGGTWVVRSALDLIQADGFLLCDATSEAHDGPTELWNEVLAALQFAKTDQAVRALLAQPKAWEKIVNSQMVLADNSGQWLIRTPTVAIVGPPNVGKSTLANQLFGQARSITADLPGTTRDWVGEIANIDGLAVMLLDTPGMRPTDDPIESAAIAASAEPIRMADLVVTVLDQSSALDHAMLAAYPSAICVANKSDAEPQWQAKDIAAIRTTATTGFGIANLRQAIRQHFGWDPIDIHRPRWWTERQSRLLHAMSLPA